MLPLLVKPFLFQSTLPVRGATPKMLILCGRLLNFNPRSPCGERLIRYIHGNPKHKFQSTLPVRGATVRCPVVLRCVRLFQSTLPVRGATQFAEMDMEEYYISIHAPRAGSDSNIAQISDDWAAILRHGFQTGPSADCGRIVINQQKTFFIAVSGARTSRAFYVYRRFASGGRSEDQCIGHIN